MMSKKVEGRLMQSGTGDKQAIGNNFIPEKPDPLEDIDSGP